MEDRNDLTPRDKILVIIIGFVGLIIIGILKGLLPQFSDGLAIGIVGAMSSIIITALGSYIADKLKRGGMK